MRIFLGLSTSIHPFPHCSLAWLTIIRFSCNMLLYSHWCWVSLDWTLQLKGSVYSWETPDVLLPGLRWLDQNKQLLQRGKSPWEGNASIWVKIPLRGTRVGCWCPWGWKGWVWAPRKCLVIPKGPTSEHSATGRTHLRQGRVHAGESRMALLLWLGLSRWDLRIVEWGWFCD